MNWVHTISILLAAFMAVFLESTFNSFRSLLGAQVDFLPGLMVYAGLSAGPITVAVTAVLGGLWFDSLSANPLGVTILPLFLIGFVLQYYRGLILREQFYAQAVLGLAASAAAPLMALLLVLNTEKQPLIHWFSIWQWLVMAVVGGAATPAWFVFFDRAMSSLSYRTADAGAFRPDREIKRGRM